MIAFIHRLSSTATAQPKTNIWRAQQFYTGAVDATSFEKTTRAGKNIATVAETVKDRATIKDFEPKELFNVDQPPLKGTDKVSTFSHKDADPATVAANLTLQTESKISAVEEACQNPLVNEKGGSVWVHDC